MVTKYTRQASSLLLSALLWVPMAEAQLPDTQAVTGQITDLGRQGLDTPRELQRELDDVALAAQREALKLEAMARDAALDPVTRALNNPLAVLPSALSIVGVNGQEVLREVVVEEGWRAVERQWLVWLPDAELANVNFPGVTVLSQEAMPDLGLVLVHLQVTPALDNHAALAQLLPPQWLSSLDRNHTYNSQASAPVSQPTQSPNDSKLSKSDAAPSPWVCPVHVTLGMVDTGVQTQHPAFSQANIIRQDFLPPELAAPDTHGTAVAGVLVGQGEALVASLPKAKLLAASAFYARSDYSQGATTQSLVQALNWLAGQPVQVINLSLAGPPNNVLALVIERLASRQIALIAAVGNEGPAAPPLYPAAYPQVVGVTAVDNQQRIYRWANQGEQVDFAALGVSVLTVRALSDQQKAAFGRESGTSMAAPLVSARLACAMASGQSLAAAQAALTTQALDLGAPQRDSIFGDGLVF